MAQGVEKRLHVRVEQDVLRRVKPEKHLIRVNRELYIGIVGVLFGEHVVGDGVAELSAEGETVVTVLIPVVGIEVDLFEIVPVIEKSAGQHELIGASPDMTTCSIRAAA